jgi:hypothetical protein
MKKLWLKIETFFVTTFGSEEKLEKFLLDHAGEAIEVFGEIKTLVQSPVITAIEVALPLQFTNAVESIRTKIETVVDKVVAELNIGQACLLLPTFGQRLSCFIMEIKKLSPKMQDAAIMKGASSYVSLIAEQPVKEAMADTAIQHVLFAKKIDLGTAAE